MKKIISWSRDAHGQVTARPLRDVCNALTLFCGGGHSEPRFGLCNTTPYVFEVLEDMHPEPAAPANNTAGKR